MGSVYAEIYRDLKAADEAKQVLLQDVRERKDLARSARHHKSGYKSTKCPLSTDNMSRKEWEQRNGSVEISFAPVRHGVYTRKAEHLRAKFLKNVRESFNATAPMIADLLGDGATTEEIRADIKLLKSNGHDVGTLANHTPSRGSMELWNAWVSKFRWPTGHIDIDEFYAKANEKRMESMSRRKSIDTAVVSEMGTGGLKTNPNTIEHDPPIILKHNVSSPVEPSIDTNEEVEEMVNTETENVTTVVVEPKIDETKKTLVVGTETIDTSTATDAEIEALTSWVKAGLAFLKNRKVEITVSVSTEE